MGALTHDAENGRAAGCFGLELATFLGGHGVAVKVIRMVEMSKERGLLVRGDGGGDDEE